MKHLIKPNEISRESLVSILEIMHRLAAPAAMPELLRRAPDLPKKRACVPTFKALANMRNWVRCQIPLFRLIIRCSRQWRSAEEMALNPKIAFDVGPSALGGDS